MPKNKIISNSANRTQLSEFARRDLDEIWTYLNKDNSQYADSLIKDFLQKFRMLADHPNLGKLHAEVLINLRSFPFRKYVIFYLPTEYGIEIFRVLHSSRNIEGIFDEFFDDLESSDRQ